MKDFYQNEQAVREYIAMRDSRTSRNELIEEPVFLRLVGDVAGKHCLDLGCGYGYYSRLLADKGATVIGVDNAALMLDEARKRTDSQSIQYELADIENLQFPPETFDIVVSNLTFHYLRDVGALFSNLHVWLRPHAPLVFTVEHPTLTANMQQEPPEWCESAEGKKWVISDYFRSGERFGFFGRKYHRTVEQYFAALVNVGFQVLELVEPSPDSASLALRPDLDEDVQRPLFLGMRCVKGDG